MHQCHGQIDACGARTKNQPPCARNESLFCRSDACLALSHIYQCHRGVAHASPLTKNARQVTKILSFPKGEACLALSTCTDVTAGDACVACEEPTSRYEDSLLSIGARHASPLSHMHQCHRQADACVAPTKNHPPYAR